MAEVKVSAAGILFDMDGVLVSSIGSVVRCWRRWAAHYGVPNADSIDVVHGVRASELMDMIKPGIDKAGGLKLIEDMELEENRRDGRAAAALATSVSRRQH